MSHSEPDEDYFEVEKILDHRVEATGEKVYFIKWKNYDMLNYSRNTSAQALANVEGSGYNTWEPEGNLYCPVILEAYHKRIKETQPSFAPSKRKQSASTMKKRRAPIKVKLLVKPSTNDTTEKRIRKKPSLYVSISLPKKTTQAQNTSLSVSASASTSTEANPPSSPKEGEQPKTATPQAMVISNEDDSSNYTISTNTKKRVIDAGDSDSDSTGNASISNTSGIIKQQDLQNTTNTTSLIDEMKNLSTSVGHHNTMSAISSSYPPTKRAKGTPASNTIPQPKSNDHDARSTLVIQSGKQHSQRNQQYQDWKKDITVKTYGSFRLQFILTHDLWGLQDDISLFMNGTDLIASTVIPFKRSMDVCKQRNYSVMELVIIGENIPNWCKLSKFLQLNEQALVVRSQERKNETILITNQNNLEDWMPETNGSLCALYVNNVNQDWVGLNTHRTTIRRLDFGIGYSWELMSRLLMFPKQLRNLIKRTNIVFEVMGISELAEMLRFTIRSTRDTMSPTLNSTLFKASSSTKKVLFIDRLDGLLYQTSLRNELFSSSTRIFAFGSPTVISPIAPAIEAYPKDTGGYLTTDARNILQNTDVLDRMTEFARNKNAIHPGTWKVVLHDKTISQITRWGTGETAQIAIDKILTSLATNDVGILDNWGEVPNEQERTTATLDWFDTVVRAHLYTYQNFYFIDDLPFAASQQQYPLIQFVESGSL